LFAFRNLRKYDVAHVHLANLQADVVVTVARLLRRPVYVKVACGGSAGEITRLAKIARLTHWVGLRRATAVQALSSEIVRELRSIGVEKERIVEIPNGLGRGPFAPAGTEERRRLRRDLHLPSDGVVVLYVGRFAQYKGILDLLDVWERRPPDGATLVLLGSGDTDKAIGAVDEAPGLIVRDWTNDVAPYLRAADLFVYPSYADGMSNALLEAMACGCGPVASRSGAAEDMIEDGRSGLLFDAGDRAALRVALDRAISDDDLRAQMSAAAADAAAGYAIEAVVDSILETYRAMVVRP